GRTHAPSDPKNFGEGTCHAPSSHLLPSESIKLRLWPPSPMVNPPVGSVLLHLVSCERYTLSVREREHNENLIQLFDPFQYRNGVLSPRESRCIHSLKLDYEPRKVHGRRGL
ncbi:Unknown protein, partial [Striga hermonthica]